MIYQSHKQHVEESLKIQEYKSHNISGRQLTEQSMNQEQFKVTEEEENKLNDDIKKMRGLT